MHRSRQNRREASPARVGPAVSAAIVPTTPLNYEQRHEPLHTAATIEALTKEYTLRYTAEGITGR